MRINHNIQALNAYRNLAVNQSNTAKNLEKLSSGLRINRAADDAAGLAISEKMRSQIRGLEVAERNALDAISLIQTAEGALSSVHSMLQRMRELAVQAANGTNTDDDRKSIQSEVEQLKNEISRIAEKTEFNTKRLLNGELSGNQLGGTGSQIGIATAAFIKVDDFDPSQSVTSGISQNVQVNVDGVTFNLTGVTGSDQFQWFQSLESKLNSAIDTYNSENPNAQVTKPKFEITDVQSQTSMDFVITSGTTGANSKIEIRLLDDSINTDAPESTDLANQLIDDANRTAGSDGKLTADAATALNSLGSTDKLTLSVNGYNIDVLLGQVGSQSFSAGDDMTTLASKLSEDINNALTAYKDLTGIGFGTVSVDVKNGSLVLNSSNPNTVKIEVAKGKEADALGLSGTGTYATGGIDFHIGANEGQNLKLQINNVSPSALNIADVDVSTAIGANNALVKLDEAIKKVSEERGKLGAIQNRLEHTINNLKTAHENLTSAESRIRDTDMAMEMTNFTKNNILNQAAQAMLAQSNQLPQGILQLLKS
ncbi:flagellin [Anoxybacillus sp. D401a]|uniref:flagellin N-terminal helical domain-containing protein n=1 Tax=Anoxybacillus sp. D401a TaxID=575112 RepID=UPI003D34B690